MIVYLAVLDMLRNWSQETLGVPDIAGAAINDSQALNELGVRVTVEEKA